MFLGQFLGDLFGDFFISDYFYKQRKKNYFVISRIVQNLFYGGNNLEGEARL
jgi:hypothetical protein